MDMARQLDIKDIAKKLLSESKDSEENLKRIQAARLRVAEAQAAKEELAQAMRAEAFEARLQEAQRAQSTQSQLADVELRMAQARLAEAKIAQLEAERDEEKWAQAINEESEKAESLKAGAIAAVAGTLACLPLTVTNADSPVVGVLSTFTFTASCLLLGVVYRYALRQDLGNSQLKGGVVAAFGLVRGLAIADSLQTSVGGELTAELVAKGALLAGQSVLTFGFAAVALEFALQRGLLKPFGTAGSFNK
mmetsp:Transcript_6572/g.18330  ORF Transcript_6572/g.18330 Transcript_6572/m.18330 type:complete len:250 (-) Transcript_6572:371-1120(-)